MFKREMKINFKNFVIWTLILIAIFLVIFLIYPSIVSSENISMMDDMMNMFPPEVLKAFNMDIASIDTVFGYLKTEGFVFILLIIGAYSALLASNVLLKEESDKTIEYLNSMPVKRTSIVLNKVLPSVIYITLMVLIIAVFNYFGLCLSEEFDKKAYILLSITPLFSSLVTFFVCLFISTFFNKTKKMLGISLGIVFISYVLQILSELSDKVEFLKYFSIFTLADTRNVILDSKINPIMVLLVVIISVLLTIITIVRYNKKELV